MIIHYTELIPILILMKLTRLSANRNPLSCHKCPHLLVPLVLPTLPTLTSHSDLYTRIFRDLISEVPLSTNPFPELMWHKLIILRRGFVLAVAARKEGMVERRAGSDAFVGFGLHELFEEVQG